MEKIILCVAFLLYSSYGHILTNRHARSLHLYQKDESSFNKDNKHQELYVESCKSGIECTPLVSCPGHVWIENKIYCKTIASRQGICCSTGRNISKVLTPKERAHHQLHLKLDSKIIGSLTHESRDGMAKLRAKETKLLTSGEPAILERGSASYSHYRNSRRFDHFECVEIDNMAKRAVEMGLATEIFKEREGVTNLELEQGMIIDTLKSTSLEYTCAPLHICPETPNKYRAIDGSCNNKLHSSWGAAKTPLSRLLAPSYDDGVWSPRKSIVNSAPLPSPRKVTATVFNEKSEAHQELSLLLMQFGQFLSHDIAQGLDFTYANGSAINCCSKDGDEILAVEHRHFACMPISLPENDYFYSGYHQRCMNFVRTVLAPRDDCTLGYSEQMNKVTHFIDGSNIYGSTPEQTSQLRSFEGGKLKFFNDYGRHLLPLSRNKDACLTSEEGTACFESGDTRTNQMITLVAMHTLFMREHNRVADVLSRLNPKWDDDKLFYEARRIVIAELQVITYKEFLPEILGEETMEEFDLLLEKGADYSFSYDPELKPSITNEFSTAAFRFGHSIVDGHLTLYDRNTLDQIIPIPEVMFYPSQLRKSKFLDMILDTLTTQPIQAVDGSFSEALTRYLFRAGNPYGVDLPSINIQRGRDHGLRPYNDYRELIGLHKFTKFEDFGHDVGEKLSMVYEDVDDVDLWVGGLLEEPAGGSLLGPVFRDIIADQFSRLKKGDRYFFENNPEVNPGQFNPDQLYQIRKATISRIICDNSDHILLTHVSLKAFRTPNEENNHLVDCQSDAIPRVDLSYWRF